MAGGLWKWELDLPTERGEPGSVLRDWEAAQGGSAVARGAAAAWHALRIPLRVGLIGGLAFLVGVAAMANPEGQMTEQALREQLVERDAELTARRGELELARLELQRLNTVVAYSREHRIPADLAATIYDMALAEGVEPRLAFSLVRVESEFTPGAVSSAGAVGLAQVMPNTAFWLQPGLSYRELFETETNLRLGFRYLRMMLAQYEGDLRLALLAYNRGPGRVDEIRAAGGDPGNGYATKVQRGQ
ncbi:MAG: lytic transglycosylase domain-containing protein [Gemmatimonadota bacterium]